MTSPTELHRHTCMGNITDWTSQKHKCWKLHRLNIKYTYGWHHKVNITKIQVFVTLQTKLYSHTSTCDITNWASQTYKYKWHNRLIITDIQVQVISQTKLRNNTSIVDLLNGTSQNWKSGCHYNLKITDIQVWVTSQTM